MSASSGWIRTVSPDLEKPSLQDNTADVDRLVKALRRELECLEVRVDLPLLKTVPARLRQWEYRVRAVVAKEGPGWRLVDVFPREDDSGVWGVAVDIGTSTVVVRIVDLENRTSVGESGFVNPQTAYGEDILTRIHFASNEDGLETLRKVLVERLNKEIARLAQAHAVPLKRLVGASLAGNTTMTHLFLGLNPFWICREPYIPAVNRLDLLTASQVGLGIHEAAPVLVFPNVGSYFGGDLIAGILASGLDRREGVSILVDVGTNAEVVLGNQDWLMACAGAAGPALEGGVARMGMMAGPGVIDHVGLEAGTGELEIHTIGEGPPVGICGSGLIDLVSRLFLTGRIDMRGKFIPEACGERLVDEDGIPTFTVVPEDASGTGEALTLSQPDVDALMRSKAAMYTILTTITGMVGLSWQDLDRFFVAGTFGSYIDPQSAVTLGMIPDLPLETYESLGNTSLEGATEGLLDGEALPRIEDIRDRITYIELNVNQEFMNLFSAAKFIPHTDRALFPSVADWEAAVSTPAP
jgi:uncharacterized 2Fe-2S/4Fe-4S cluster protein (DUF4445 family)